MDTLTIFGKTFSTLEKALDIRARRHELLISNITNADTPGFKAFDIEFENAMKPDLKDKKNMNLERTSPDHLTGNKNTISYGIKPQMIDISKEVTLRGDGNTVNMEREMGSLSENNLMYQISTQLINKKFQGILGAIQGGKK